MKYGADLARVVIHGHNRVGHAAMRDADAGAHPDCDGGGCGDWVLSGTNDAEWQRLGALRKSTYTRLLIAAVTLLI